MATGLIASFLLLAIPTFFTPGPNNLMLMTSSARFGPRRTVPHALGIIFGFPLMVFGVGLGLGQIFTLYPWLSAVMRWAAAAYFLWLAWHLLGLRISSPTELAEGRPMRAFEAAAFQWVNPKAWAMATSFVAALVQPDNPASVLWLTAGCLAIAPFSSIVWMVFGHQLAALLRRTGTERYLGLVLALLMLTAVALFVF